MNQPMLQAVPLGDREGAVDSWVMPTNLPNGVAIFPRRFQGERFWTFDSEKIILIPMPAQKVEDTLKDYVDYPVLVHNHRHALLASSDNIPEHYQPFILYFVSDVYVRHSKEPNQLFIYCLKYKDGKWSEDEVRCDTIPGKGTGRIIMMR